MIGVPAPGQHQQLEEGPRALQAELVAMVHSLPEVPGERNRHQRHPAQRSQGQPQRLPAVGGVQRQQCMKTTDGSPVGTRLFTPDHVATVMQSSRRCGTHHRVWPISALIP